MSASAAEVDRAPGPARGLVGGRAAWAKGRIPLLGGVAVAVVAALVLTASHRPVQGPLPVARAIAAARRAPAVARILTGRTGVVASATPVDGALERVRFSAGGRAILDAGVDANGRVTHIGDYAANRVPYGNWIAYEPALLALLGVVFVLTAGVAPLRRRRNLDVLALLSLTVPMLLLKARMLDASVLAAVPGLGYLLVRCVRVAVGSGAGTAAAVATRPLLEVVTPGWGPERRRRLLRLMLAALGVVTVMVAVSSTDPVDVLFAVMEGATRLVHGVLPYGHLPGDVVHGDTYPPLSYALYAPLAALRPVSSEWNGVDLGLGAAAVATLVSAGLLGRGSARRPRAKRARRLALPGSARRKFEVTLEGEAAAGSPSEAARADGLRLSVAWLSFPPLLAIASTGTTDVVLAATLLGAVLLWRRPAAGAAALSAAGWFKLAPFALIPPFAAALRGRALGRAAAAAVLVSVLALGMVVAIGGTGGLAAMARAIGWQFHRGSPQSLWAVLGLDALQPMGMAGALGLIAALTLHVWTSAGGTVPLTLRGAQPDPGAGGAQPDPGARGAQPDPGARGAQPDLRGHLVAGRPFPHPGGAPVAGGRPFPHLGGLASRAQVAALAAAILIALQLSADYWSFLYLAWIVPLLCLALLGNPVAAGEPRSRAERPEDRSGSTSAPRQPMHTTG